MNMTCKEVDTRGRVDSSSAREMKCVRGSATTRLAGGAGGWSVEAHAPRGKEEDEYERRGRRGREEYESEGGGRQGEYWRPGYSIDEMRAGELMTRNVLTVHPQDRVGYAARLMRDY